MFFNIFGRKKEERKPPITPKKEEKKAAQKKEERTQAMLKDIAKKIKDHDRYVKENVATQLSIRELIQSLSKRFQALPITSGDKPLKDLPKLSTTHEKILKVFMSDMSRDYSYKEIATTARLSPSGVRGMISELKRLGFEFLTSKDGREVRIMLVHSQPIPSASSASSD